MQLTDLTGINGVAFSLVWLALRLPKLRDIQQRAWLALALLLTVLIPWGGLSLAECVRGISGDLSISTLVLLLATLRAQLAPRQSQSFWWLMLLAAGVLYPFALGIGSIDPYRLGFSNSLFILSILGIVLFALWQKFTLIVLALSLSVLAWSVGYYESTNLWDYLLDPWLAIYAIWAALKLLLKCWSTVKSDQC